MRIHLSLQTTDLAASEAFYTALFGERPDKVRHNYLRFAPATAPIVLSLMPGQPGEDGGSVHHMGLRHEDVAETKAAWKRLADSGLPVETEGEVTCCWSVQNKAWVHDPDGRSWELYTLVDDEPRIEREESRACCA